ncbi:MAG TPA: Wzz/FepE/Etk N-terminal domain-containing protein [Vicinamibacterales bacterium]|nr:Wzz/FepE/Etk N-terminal domain-containing protein [Vicinamibacterales bacterium]
MSERRLHPVEYLGILKRRRLWFIVPFAVCLLVGAALALFLPPTYRTNATIAVQAPAVAPELVPARAGLDQTERLRALSQQLRSPAVLERVAREEGLTAEGPIEDITQSMLGRISVEIPRPIARTEGNAELNAFDIVYRDRTPQRTHRIANRLAQVFVDEHSRSREKQAEGTAEFLARQLRASQDRISTLETRLRTAKEIHMGKLPEQTTANLQTLTGLRQQLESTSTSLRSEQDRLGLIERQMQSMRQGIYSVPGAAGSAPSSPQQRVAALQRELALARAKYTEKHPEIQYLEEELKSARAQLAAMAQQPESIREELLSSDPAYQQLVAERNLTQLRVRSLQRTEARLHADIARYQQRVEAAPMVEQEMASLQREFDFERENYKQLSAKHAAALLQEQIAHSRGGERFSVLYAAYLPGSPESPNRLRLLLMALGAGLALGGALAFAREYLDWSIRDARVLQDEFDVPVLAEIPRIRSAQ